MIRNVSKALTAASAALAALIGAGVLTGVSLTIASFVVAALGAVLVGLATYASPKNA